FRNVFFRAIHFETSNTQFEQFADTLLPVLASFWIGEVNHRIVVAVGGPHLSCECVTLRESFLHHLSLKERCDPKHCLGVVTVKPLHHPCKVRQTIVIDVEIVVTPGLAGPPWTIDPVDTVWNSEGAHHQHVFHDFGIEWASDGSTVVVSRA